MGTYLKKLSFHKKIIIIFVILICVSSTMVGLTAYLISRDSLNNKGEVILKNAVTQALMLIDTEYMYYNDGSISESEAIENIKTKLLGPLNTDGTRTLHNHINLGENGYFIIYDREGNEIMHPTLEDKNVWSVVDFSDQEHKLVQEQINYGLNGGGFTYYSWLLPHSDKVGQKIAYSNYDVNWDWIVVSTAYTMDFNSESTKILYVLIFAIGLNILICSYIIIGYISEVTKPILRVAEGMLKISKNDYEKINTHEYGGEIDILLNGYNNMLDNLKAAESDVLEHQEKLTYLAYHDELTCLPNRIGLKVHVTKRLAKNIKSAYMIQFDIVELKEINSMIGFQKGDEILQLVAQYLGEHNRIEYFSARTSSNEFCLWIEKISIEEVQKKISVIRQDIKDLIFQNGINHVIELYAAIAIFEKDANNFESLYENVTIAMKEAKEHKDLNVNIYIKEMKEAVEHDLLMKQYLYTAINNEEIVPYYQAKIDYTNGQVIGVEALARWNSSKLGFVSPSIFIPALTRLNLMNEFTDYMINRVLSDYKELKLKYNSDINVSINVPPSVFIEKEVYTMIKIALNKSEVPGHKVIIEITEDVFIADINKVNHIVDKLHGLGIKIAIDDFGTGYSSLNYLTNIDFDEMKIDKSFIDKITVDEKEFELFEILCQIAEVYGYHLVAEGVETEEQLEKIKLTSLKTIQGYLFSKPEAL